MLQLSSASSHMSYKTAYARYVSVVGLLTAAVQIYSSNRIAIATQLLDIPLNYLRNIEPDKCVHRSIYYYKMLLGLT